MTTTQWIGIAILLAFGGLFMFRRAKNVKREPGQDPWTGGDGMPHTPD